MKLKRFATAALVIALAFAQAVPAGAETISGLKEQKAETTKKLDDVEDSIDDLEDKKKEITGEIESLDAELVTTLASIDELKDQITETEEEIANTEQDLEEAEERREEEYEGMQKRIQYIYENGGDASWATRLLAEEDLTGLLNEAEYTQQMYEYDRECLNEYIDTENEISELKEQQEEQKAELESMKEEEEVEKERLQKMLEEKKITSHNYDVELEEAKEKAQEYRSLIDEQNKKIKELIKKQEEERKRREEAERKAREAAAKAAAEAAEAAAKAKSSSESSGSSDSSSSGSGSASGQAIVNYALQFVGNRYVWGGNSLTNGTDCSGFVHLIYRHFGYSVPRQSGSLRSAGRGVSYSEAKPGDIICYSGHVAIYMGNGKIVHAASARTGIKVSSNAAYRTILAVRRIV